MQRCMQDGSLEPCAHTTNISQWRGEQEWFDGDWAGDDDYHSVADSWAPYGDWQETDEDEMTWDDTNLKEASWDRIEEFPEELTQCHAIGRLRCSAVTAASSGGCRCGGRRQPTDEDSSETFDKRSLSKSRILSNGYSRPTSRKKETQRHG